MFSMLYSKVMRWAEHRYAVFWLALVSFAESSFFIIPPDVILMPMCLAKREKAWRYAALTTLMSVLGGLLGYLIGAYAFQFIELWLMQSHYAGAFGMAQKWFTEWGLWAILLVGFTPIPYKIFTITAGVIGMALAPFIIGSLLGRGMRFFLVAGLMWWGGERLQAQLPRWIDRIGWITIGIVVCVYLILKYH